MAKKSSNKTTKKKTTRKKSTAGKTRKTSAKSKSTKAKTKKSGTKAKSTKTKSTAARTKKKSSAAKTRKKTTRSKATAKKPVKKTTKRTKKSPATREVEVLSPSKVMRKVKGYGKKDLEAFKQVIMDKREEIIEQLENLKDQMMDPSTGQYVNESSPYSLHMAEQGTDAQEREKLYLWAQRENKFLGYLEEALQRIENGTYGLCIECIDDPKKLCPSCPLIPKERLMAVPHTQLCVQVKMAQKK